MWRLCGVIIKVHLSDPQVNFESILEIHFLFIYEIPIYRISHLKLLKTEQFIDWELARNRLKSGSYIQSIICMHNQRSTDQNRWVQDQIGADKDQKK